MSDNILDRSDKRCVKQLYDAIVDEQSALVAQAQARDVDRCGTERNGTGYLVRPWLFFSSWVYDCRATRLLHVSAVHHVRRAQP